MFMVGLPQFRQSRFLSTASNLYASRVIEFMTLKIAAFWLELALDLV
jgi:hypothetical protein